MRPGSTISALLGGSIIAYLTLKYDLSVQAFGLLLLSNILAFIDGCAWMHPSDWEG